jgi:hypothetical protein
MWSVGLLLHVILTGRNPFQRGTEIETLQAKAKRLTRRFPHISHPISPIHHRHSFSQNTR